MKKVIIIIMSFTGIVLAQEKYIDRYMALAVKGHEATQSAAYDTALMNYEELLSIAVQAPRIHYEIARLHALLDQPEKAMSSLSHALVLGYDFGDTLDSSFVALSKKSVFEDVQKMIQQMQCPINKSEIALTVPGRDLIPEGLAYDPVDDCFYMGSIEKCKIVRFDRQGDTVDFTSEKQDGLRAVLGMEVDVKRRILWATSVVTQVRPDIGEEEVGWSGLYKYDLNTGRLIKKYILHEEGVNHLFNDVSISDNGDVYMTDTDAHTIYRVLHDKDELELYLQPPEFLWPNGISFGADDETLYMASSGNGIYRIVIPSKSYKLLARPDDVSTIGIDGMYFYQNSLICVQNGLQRISRFYLNPKGDGVDRVEVIETRNPHFIIPTTGAIAGDTFYYIANSQLRAISPEGDLLPWDQLKETVILKTDLN